MKPLDPILVGLIHEGFPIGCLLIQLPLGSSDWSIREEAVISQL